MNAAIVFAALLLPFTVLAQGEIVIQPSANGNISLYSAGASSGTPSGMVSIEQPLGKEMVLQLISTSPGTCENGDIVLDSIHIPVSQLLNNRRLMCGEITTLSAPSQTQQVVLKVEKTQLRQQADSLARNPYGNRVLVARINSQVQGGMLQSTPVYVDFTLLQATLPSLSATFDTASLDFGPVGEMRDAIASTRLRVTKTLHAGESVLPYEVSFESNQRKENQYRLRASIGESLIPYGIFIDGTELTPGDPYHSKVPAGVATSDVLNIEFHLPGKVTRGMAAGARLLDTVTAVITPES
jgi:hypothetical protein